MLGITCRNGEHYTVDPAQIERVEVDPDTVLYLVDGTKYVVDQTLDDLILAVRDHRAALTVRLKRLAGGTAEIADHASNVRNSALRVERREYDRSVDNGRSAADRRPVEEPPDTDGA